MINYRSLGISLSLACLLIGLGLHVCGELHLVSLNGGRQIGAVSLWLLLSALLIGWSLLERPLYMHDQPCATRRLLLDLLLFGAIFWLGLAWYESQLNPYELAFRIQVHPDQNVPLKVLQQMRLHRDFNADWARTDMNPFYAASRYNFSGWLLASYVAISAFQSAAFASPLHLLIAVIGLSTICAALTLGLCFFFVRRWLGWGYAILGTLLVALIPQLYQDAHYPRPEAMSTLLFTLSFVLCTLQVRTSGMRFVLIAAIGVLAGFLASIKFTQAVAVLFCVPMLLDSVRGASVARTRIVFGKAQLTLAAIACIAFVIGFAMGAPYVILDPQGYLQGIRNLQQEYGHSLPPYSAIHPGLAQQVGHVVAFYAKTLGLPIFTLHIIGYSHSALKLQKATYAVVAAITVAGLVSQPVFFERNYSPLLPVFMLIGLFGIAELMNILRNWRAVTCGAVSSGILVMLAFALIVSCAAFAFPVTYVLSWHFDPIGATRYLKRWKDISTSAAARIGAVNEEYVDDRTRVEPMIYPAGGPCTLFFVIDHNDEWARRYMGSLPARFQVLSKMPSAFSSIPTSTLVTYVEPSVYWFYDTTVCGSGTRANASSASLPGSNGILALPPHWTG